jgi:hypothetical protein
MRIGREKRYLGPSGYSLSLAPQTTSSASPIHFLQRVI